MLPIKPCISRSLRYCRLPYCDPRSECTINPACGWRCQIAILNAAHTSLAFILELMLQPTTFLDPNVGYVADVDLIRGGNIKLSIQLILKYRLFVIAVSGHFVLLPVSYLHVSFPHQASSFPSTNRIAQRIQRFSNSAAAVGIMAGFPYVPDRFKYFLVTRVRRTISVHRT